MRQRLVVCAVLMLSLILPVATPSEAQPAARPAAALRLLRRTEHFAVYLQTGSLRRAEALRLADRLEGTLAAVSERFGTPFNGRERVELLPPQKGACAVRGLTWSQKRLIQLFYGPGSDLDRLQAIMAHELVHQLQRERFGDKAHQAADIILLEGWATVASDDFARTPDGSEARWRARMRDTVRRGEILPLTVDLDQDCRTTTRNSIYDHWASFVDYLQGRYGAKAFADVYAQGTGRKAGTARYASVYGKSFAELEAEWRNWVVTQ